MDRREKTIDVIRKVNSYYSGECAIHELIKNICEYFDYIKGFDINQFDYQLLLRLCNIVGIPHYLDQMLKISDFDEGLVDFNLSSLGAILHESSLQVGDSSKLHRFQKEVLDLFSIDCFNRYLLSASTSFGKTHLSYEIIKKMNYENVIFIFPTIALLSENLIKIKSDNFFDDYDIYTLSGSEYKKDNKSIFVFTPERFLSFSDKNGDVVFDFVVVDEFYKMDSSGEYSERSSREDGRDLNYRVAVQLLLSKSRDFLMIGPYVSRYHDSFSKFLNYNKIKILDYNDYEIVGKKLLNVKGEKRITFGDDVSFNFSGGGKKERLIDILKVLISENNENAIVYCPKPSSVEAYSKLIYEDFHELDCDGEFSEFINHVSEVFGSSWVVCKCLLKGIGVHHGLVPKYIQKDIIKFFNSGFLKVLVSTTTITEGVNTSAKNVIVIDNKKGNSSLKRFDAKNISGRAGRFGWHFVGRVFAIKNSFISDLNSEDSPLEHVGYNDSVDKNDVDLIFSHGEFLTDNDGAKIIKIKNDQKSVDIPDYVLNEFKTVSHADKIHLYRLILGMADDERAHVENLISSINRGNGYSMYIDWAGMQIVLDIISSICNEKLRSFIEKKARNGESLYSIVIPILNSYLSNGLKGLVDYRVGNGEGIDSAMRDSAKFVYNTAKYQLAKYIGVFSILYRFHKGKISNTPFENVVGLDRLLSKLEFNALTEPGKIASDYGVPLKVLQYYENDRAELIRNNFDAYEQRIFSEVDAVVNSQS